jgi:hypothetical protein
MALRERAQILRSLTGRNAEQALTKQKLAGPCGMDRRGKWQSLPTTRPHWLSQQKGSLLIQSNERPRFPRLSRTKHTKNLLSIVCLNHRLIDCWSFKELEHAIPRRRTVKKVGAARCGVSTSQRFARCACQRHYSPNGTEDHPSTAADGASDSFQRLAVQA